MGKRSSFVRIPRDAYDTPAEAVAPLLPHLEPESYFVEPCAGRGALIEHLEDAGHSLIMAYDIEPRSPRVHRHDVFGVENFGAELYITNPPWARSILHPLIIHLSDQAPTWLLFDAAWAFTKQSRPFMNRCRKIVAIGRIRWIPGTKMTGKDDCAWYLFDKPSDAPTLFYGRV